MKTHTLLLVSENTALRRVVEATLSGGSVEVRTVADAAGATARIQSAPPDVILVDVDAPAQRADEVVAFVKGHTNLASTPVWLVGDSRAVARATPSASSLGYDTVLDLPLDPSQVAVRVRQLLKTKVSRVTPPEDESFDAFLERLDSQLASHNARPPHHPTEPTIDARHRAAGSEKADVPTMALLLEATQTQVRPSGEESGPQTPDAVDEVARRVMARLSSGSMHEIVSRIVTEVVSRLAVEEAKK